MKIIVHVKIQCESLDLFGAVVVTVTHNKTIISFEIWINIYI